VAVAVLTADRMDCSQSPLQLADVGSSLGGVVHLSSSLVPGSQSPDTGSCGSESAPWKISAHPGQRVRVTLLDFDVAVQPPASLNASQTDTAFEVSCTSTSWGQTVYV